MFTFPAAEQLFHELLHRFPALMSPRHVSREGNEGLTGVYAALKSKELESFCEPGTRKRQIMGRSAAFRIAKKLDTALAAGTTVAAELSKATAASLKSRRRKRERLAAGNNERRQRGQVAGGQSR
jgi:hypothetical protein